MLFPFQPETVEEALSFRADLSIFASVLRAANLTSLLNSSTANVTLLAPNNAAFHAAFAELNVSGVDELAESDPLMLLKMVNVHVLPGVVPWALMYDHAGTRYFRTCNTCASYYVQLDHVSGMLEFFGVGNAQVRRLCMPSLSLSLFSLDALNPD